MLEDSHNLIIDKYKMSVVKSSGLDLEKYMKNLDQNKINALKNELSIIAGQTTFILVSRMVKQKGILDYLEAAKKCYENGYKFNFLLVGQLDSDESITLEQINAYKQYVNFLGRREDVKELLSVSNVFVLPTYYREGVPRVLLEASAIGLGLITTNMPGCKDVVIDDYNGKLVHIKDPDDLYKKMIYVGTNNEVLHKFSLNAKKKVKEFDLDIVVDKYHKIYKK
jgi:glycosyltransferase involved in cell wall biosynthesis